MQNKIYKFIVFSTLLLSSACVSNARMTQHWAVANLETNETNRGGTVKIDGPYMSSMHKAFKLMLEYCDGRYDWTMVDDTCLEFYCRE